MSTSKSVSAMISGDCGCGCGGSGGCGESIAARSSKRSATLPAYYEGMYTGGYKDQDLRDALCKQGGHLNGTVPSGVFGGSKDRGYKDGACAFFSGDGIRWAHAVLRIIMPALPPQLGPYAGWTEESLYFLAAAQRLAGYGITGLETYTNEDCSYLQSMIANIEADIAAIGPAAAEPGNAQARNEKKALNAILVHIRNAYGRLDCTAAIKTADQQNQINLLTQVTDQAAASQDTTQTKITTYAVYAIVVIIVIVVIKKLLF